MAFLYRWNEFAGIEAAFALAVCNAGLRFVCQVCPFRYRTKVKNVGTRVLRGPRGNSSSRSSVHFNTLTGVPPRF